MYKDFEKAIMVTGGAGFIGSHLVRHLVNNYPNWLIINFDKLTYAGNLENLIDIEEKPNYIFVNGDISDMFEVDRTFRTYLIDDIINLAAESHVDNSIKNPESFIYTNIFGTFTLLEVAREYWKSDYSKHRFHHVSTDEVYGSLGPLGKFVEDTPYNPHSPYSASKASSDHLVQSYHDTYGLNTTISNCSNNYGPNQFPEKLIPKVVMNAVQGKPIPIYGKGENVRDWLYVQDHVEAIDLIFQKGVPGRKYNIGGNSEYPNLYMVTQIVRLVEEYFKVDDAKTSLQQLITFVEDRKGHDLRYAIDATRIEKELGWKPRFSFKEGLISTVNWYLENSEWLLHIENKEYINYNQRKITK